MIIYGECFSVTASIHLFDAFEFLQMFISGARLYAGRGVSRTCVRLSLTYEDATNPRCHSLILHTYSRWLYCMNAPKSDIILHKPRYDAFDRVPPKSPAPGMCSWKSPAVYACHEFAKSPPQRHPHSKFASNPFIHVRWWVGGEILLLTFRASNVTTRCARAAERKVNHRTTQRRVQPWCSFSVLSQVRLCAFRWFIEGWKVDPAFEQLFMSVGSQEHCLQCFDPLRLSDLRLNIEFVRTFKGEHLHLSTISTHRPTRLLRPCTVALPIRYLKKLLLYRRCGRISATRPRSSGGEEMPPLRLKSGSKRWWRNSVIRRIMEGVSPFSEYFDCIRCKWLLARRRGLAFFWRRGGFDDGAWPTYLLYGQHKLWNAESHSSWLLWERPGYALHYNTICQGNWLQELPRMPDVHCLFWQLSLVPLQGYCGEHWLQ